MENKKSINAVDTSIFANIFRKPLYDSYCFSKIPDTILKIFNPDIQRDALPDDVLHGLNGEYDNVVLLLVDAFGWNSLKRYTEKKKNKVLCDICENAVVSKITSMFPSTTSVHVTTMLTGLPVAEHGVLEWYYYEKRLDRVIAPLLYSYVVSDDQLERETIAKDGKPTINLFPKSHFLNELKRINVTPYLVQHRDYCESSYNDQICGDEAKKLPFSTTEEGLQQIANTLLSSDEKKYLYFYYPVIDAMFHDYGFASPEADRQVDDFFTLLDKNLLSKIKEKKSKTLFVITADHGIINLNSSKTIYFDQAFPDLLQYLRLNSSGDYLAPAGGLTDYFLYVKEEYVDKVQNELNLRLQGIAQVWKTSDLIAEVIFGRQQFSEIFMNNMPELIILSTSNVGCYWKGLPGKEYPGKNMIGFHGGLSKEEMESVFIAMEI